MGMLIHHTWQEQQNAVANAPVNEEEIPFTEPEENPEPVEEQKKPARKTAPATRRRKPTK